MSVFAYSVFFLSAQGPYINYKRGLWKYQRHVCVRVRISELLYSLMCACLCHVSHAHSTSIGVLECSVCVCVCVCVRTVHGCSRWDRVVVAGWSGRLGRRWMDGWMRTSLSHFFHGERPDSSVWPGTVILHVGSAVPPLPHTTSPREWSGLQGCPS